MRRRVSMRKKVLSGIAVLNCILLVVLDVGAAQ